jgi:hypothetical protein
MAEPKYEARLLRTAWLDNDRLVVAWPGQEQDEEDGLSVATVTLGARGPTRVWHLRDVRKCAEKFVWPLALAGSRLLAVVDSNLVVRFDLRSGRAESRLCRGEDLALYPAGQADFVLYSSKEPGPGKAIVELGALDASTFALKPLFRFESDDFGSKEHFALSRDAKKLALLGKPAGAVKVRLLQTGQAERTLTVPCEVEVDALGNACFAGNGNALYVAFLGNTAADTNRGLGFLEVPFDGKPARPTFLVRKVGPNADDDALRYFEIALSHDAKTLAVATTYLCGDEKEGVAPSDCALFLADLTKTPHAITKARLPLPKPDKGFN